MTDLYDRLVSTAELIAERTGRPQHDVVVVLGSGLGGYPETLDDTVEISYADLPGFPLPKAIGHSGRAFSSQVGDNAVLLLSGRGHAYEGHHMDVITFPIRAAILAGCRTVLLTNAAGGCGDGIEPGDLVLITDHINMSGISPLMGDNDDRLGPRFPDMTDVYAARLRRLAHEAAAEAGLELEEGIYFWWHGPMYETPAEVQMAKQLGASLVGMSTVPEATAARHMGADVLGISLCTNFAAGISATRLSSDAVIETASRTAGSFASMFDALLPKL